MDAGLFTANNVWMMICTALVFFMHTGFAFLEIGLTRQKNTINILFKNIFIITVGLLLYYAWGFNMMYPGFEEGSSGIFGFAGFGIAAPENGMTAEYADGGYTWWTDFLFQGMFAATAATIVSGAVAERMKIGAFMIFTVIYVGLVYPIVGAWKWGGGFLDSWGFYDFAGSTLVHSVGGWAALVAIYLLGSRIGKFGEDGKPKAIPGHNIPLATAGVLILWLGWFGFNGGSVLSADPELTSLVLVTTSLSAATFIGLLSGIIIVLGVALVDKLKLDDPVGAVAVHLICGIWGTLAVGIFGSMAGAGQFLTQLYGVLIVGGFCLVTSGIIIGALKAITGIRVTKEEEVEGLDLHEHGMDAYSDFRMNQH